MTSKNQLILMLLKKDVGFLKVDRQGSLLVPKNGQEVMITMAKCLPKHCLTFTRASCNLLITAPFDGVGWESQLENETKTEM